MSTNWIAVAHFRHFEEAYDYLKMEWDEFEWVENDTGVMYVSKDSHFRVRAYVDEEGRSCRAVELDFGPEFKTRVEEMLACITWAQETLSTADYLKFMEMLEWLVKEDLAGNFE